jgi:hypothetical protein
MPAIGSIYLVQGKAKHRMQQSKLTQKVSRMNSVCSSMVAQAFSLQIIYIDSLYRVHYPGVLISKIGRHL